MWHGGGQRGLYSLGQRHLFHWTTLGRSLLLLIREGDSPCLSALGAQASSPSPRQSADPQSRRSCFISGPLIVPSSLSALLYHSSGFQEHPWLEIAPQMVSLPILCPSNLSCSSADRTTAWELTTLPHETTRGPPARE